MRQCKKCKYQNPDYINICLNCGNELDEFKNKTITDNQEPVSEASVDSCDCGQDHDQMSADSKAYDTNTTGKYNDNYYIDNTYQLESVPIDYNGKKSYYDYLQSLKDEVKPEKTWYKFDNKKILAMIALFAIVIILVTPCIVSTYQESTERSMFNTYAASSINLEVNANDFIVNIISANMSTDEKLVLLDNMTGGLNKSITALENFENASSNDTHKEFIALQVETLKVDKEVIDSYKALLDVENKYEKGEISDREAYSLLQNVDLNQTDNEKFLDNHKKMNDIIEKNPLIKSDFNSLRITPIYQTLARSANQTGNNTTTNMTN